MSIWIRGWNGKWKKSWDNSHWFFRLHLWLAYQRWWQLLITPKHIVLGAWYSYTSEEIRGFVKQHLREQLSPSASDSIRCFLKKNESEKTR